MPFHTREATPEGSSRMWPLLSDVGTPSNASLCHCDCIMFSDRWIVAMQDRDPDGLAGIAPAHRQNFRIQSRHRPHDSHNSRSHGDPRQQGGASSRTQHQPRDGSMHRAPGMDRPPHVGDHEPGKHCRLGADGHDGRAVLWLLRMPHKRLPWRLRHPLQPLLRRISGHGLQDRAPCQLARAAPAHHGHLPGRRCPLCGLGHVVELRHGPQAQGSWPPA